MKIKKFFKNKKIRKTNMQKVYIILRKKNYG